jgi:hypothetical protein
MTENQNTLSLTLPFSPACERNKGAILDVIAPYLQNATSVLEIGSGTGQHAVYFGSRYTQLKWQTSDQQQYRAGIEAQLSNAKSSNPDLDNLLSPITLNVNQPNWLPQLISYDIVYTANTLHIMTWEEVLAFFNGLPKVSRAGSGLIVYGPFKYAGQFTSESNQRFDQSLRAREVGSAIRDFEAVNELAAARGFDLEKDVAMPANNQCLIWRRH